MFILFNFSKNAMVLGIVRADVQLVNPGSPVPVFILALVPRGWSWCPTGHYIV